MIAHGKTAFDYQIESCSESRECLDSVEWDFPTVSGQSAQTDTAHHSSETSQSRIMMKYGVIVSSRTGQWLFFDCVYCPF